MKTTEKFTPSFNQYFIVDYAENESISFIASDYSDLQIKLAEFNNKFPDYTLKTIEKIETVKFMDYLRTDLEFNMIELQSLLDFSMKGLSPIVYDEEEGLIPLLNQLHELKSKMTDMIDKVEKQSKFYEKQQPKDLVS
jgi:hypothetical protein